MNVFLGFFDSDFSETKHKSTLRGYVFWKRGGEEKRDAVHSTVLSGIEVYMFPYLKRTIVTFPSFFHAHESSGQ